MISTHSLKYYFEYYDAEFDKLVGGHVRAYSLRQAEKKVEDDFKLKPGQYQIQMVH